MLNPYTRVARLAECQHSVFSRAQALGLDLSPDQIDGALRRGWWSAVHRAVYRISGATLTEAGRAFAATLAASGWASHETAGVLFELDRVTVCEPHVIVAGRRRKRVPGVIVHHPLWLPESDLTWIGVIPVTTPARTIIDLAGRQTKDALEDALDSAIRKEFVRAESLRARVEAMEPIGHPGIGALRELVRERCGTPVSGSVLENDLRRALRGTGLAMPAQQHIIRTPTGEFVGRVDFAYPEVKVFIEADGYERHSSRKDWERDRNRQNRLAELGWVPLRITKRQLQRRPEEVVVMIARATTRLPGSGVA